MRLLAAFGKKWWPVSIAAILCALFLFLTSEMLEANAGQDELVGRMDHSILARFAEMRTPGTNAFAIGFTALGSGIVLAVIVVGFVLFLASSRMWDATAQIFSSGVGAMVLMPAFKNHFGRARPDVLIRLIEVDGFSYPSGHSLAAGTVYSMLAIIACEKVESIQGRVALVVFFLVLILGIGISRIYLGVHYFSDVSAGILIGFAWSLIVFSLSLNLKSRFQAANG